MKGNLVLAGGALRLYRPILIVPKASENKGVVNVCALGRTPDGSCAPSRDEVP